MSIEDKLTAISKYGFKVYFFFGVDGVTLTRHQKPVRGFPSVEAAIEFAESIIKEETKLP